jgi:hypothetical protein
MLLRGSHMAVGAVQICNLPRVKVTKFTSKQIFLSPYVTFGENERQGIYGAFFPKLCKVVPVARFHSCCPICNSDAKKCGSGNSLLRPVWGLFIRDIRVSKIKRTYKELFQFVKLGVSFGVSANSADADELMVLAKILPSPRPNAKGWVRALMTRWPIF